MHAICLLKQNKEEDSIPILVEPTLWVQLIRVSGRLILICVLYFWV